MDTERRTPNQPRFGRLARIWNDSCTCCYLFASGDVNCNMFCSILAIIPAIANRLHSVYSNFS